MKILHTVRGGDRVTCIVAEVSDQLRIVQDAVVAERRDRVMR